MKHKTSELSGALLDAAVAKAEGWTPQEVRAMLEPGADSEDSDTRYLAASSSWGLAGPIVERERISLRACADRATGAGYWLAGNAAAVGDTPLIAAMRAFVASRFGEEVELP